MDVVAARGLSSGRDRGHRDAVAPADFGSGRRVAGGSGGRSAVKSRFTRSGRSPASELIVVWGPLVSQRARLGQFTTDWPQFMTIAIVALIPVFVFFMFCQRWITAGLVAGSVKG